ncbi:hypothetical protein E4U49_004245, partial [Claviceps purpurea]
MPPENEVRTLYHRKKPAETTYQATVSPLSPTISFVPNSALRLHWHFHWRFHWNWTIPLELDATGLIPL